MGKTVQDVYGAFLARVTSDEWMLPEDIEYAEKDWRMLLDIAISRFMIPRVSLSISNTGEFEGAVTNDEVQVLATFMKHEWVKRCISSWETIKMLYSNRDFSQANHLDKLIKFSAQIEIECDHAEKRYSRAPNHESYDYTVMAGG